MSRYRIRFARRADMMLLQHVEFLSRVSVSAAEIFYEEMKNVISRIEDNPFQFPVEEDLNLPEGVYHKAIIARCYKILFSINDDVVNLDAIIDCRRDNKDFH